MSEELIPAVSDQAARVEEEMPTGHEFEPCDLICDDDPFFEEEGVDWELENILGKTELRAYEDGPPALGVDMLAKLHEEMNRVEEQRLLDMGVLKPLEDETKKANMFQLSFNFVHDWRFRDKSVRRSRMVAREFRFLELRTTTLYKFPRCPWNSCQVSTGS